MQVLTDVRNIVKLIIRLRKILAPRKLRVYDYFALLLIEETPGLCPKEIRQELVLLPAGVTRLLNHLESMGLIERQRGTDRRTVPCDLTKKGHLVISEIDRQFLA